MHIYIYYIYIIYIYIYYIYYIIYIIYIYYILYILHNMVHVKRSILPISPNPQPLPGGSATREPCGSHATLGEWQLSVAAGGVARLGGDLSLKDWIKPTKLGVKLSISRIHIYIYIFIVVYISRIF